MRSVVDPSCFYRTWTSCRDFIAHRQALGVEEHRPVHTDGTEVKYGCSAQHHIHGHQPITHHHVQGPHSTLELDTDSKYTNMHVTKLFAGNVERVH